MNIFHPFVFLTDYKMVNLIREIKDMTRPSLEKRLQVANNIGLHATLRYTLLCARVMGFLPLSGLTSFNGRDVR